MSRIISIIIFILLLILLLVQLKQCTTAPKISKQHYLPTQPIATEGTIQRTPITANKQETAPTTEVKNPNPAPKKTQTTPLKEETAKQKIVSPSEAVANAARKAQHHMKQKSNVSPYIILEGVNFKFESADLDTKASTRLDKIVKRLKARPNLSIEIAGYADNKENNGINSNISQLRAEAVKDYILSSDIQANRLIAKGYGTDNPVAENTSTEGRKQNRRVEIHVKLEN